MKEKLIGKITHYFPKVEAAVVKLNGVLKIGDRIKLKKDEQEFEQIVECLQTEHKNIKSAKKGQEVGLKVNQKVKEGWKIYKVKSEK